MAVLDKAQVLNAVLMLSVGLCGFLLLNWRPGFVAVVLALMIARGGFLTLETSLSGDRERSYFGIYTVEEVPQEKKVTLTHGTTLHGLQRTETGSELDPTTYYGGTSGVGLALAGAERLVGANARVGAVGLGVGTLACYRTEGQVWEFFEIDPVVLEYSTKGDFTFMQECAPGSKVHLGDARIALEGMEQERYDILVIDAFSSDAIPLHLVTQEAFAIYDRVLAEDGVALIHISNRFIELEPMIAALAETRGWHSAVRFDNLAGNGYVTASKWVALSPDAGLIEQLRSESVPWRDLPPPAERVWTDDFASILPFLQWENVLGTGS